MRRPCIVRWPASCRIHCSKNDDTFCATTSPTKIAASANSAWLFGTRMWCCSAYITRYGCASSNPIVVHMNAPHAPSSPMCGRTYFHTRRISRRSYALPSRCSADRPGRWTTAITRPPRRSACRSRAASCRARCTRRRGRSDPRDRSGPDRRARHARRADRPRRRVQRALQDAARDRHADRRGGRVMAVVQRPGLSAEQVLGKAYDLRLIRRVWKYVRPHIGLLGAWVAFMCTTIVFELAQPYLVMYALQHHILVPNSQALFADAAIFVGLVVAQNVSSFFEQWFLQLAGQRTMHGLRISIFDHVLAQRAAFFDRIPVGRLMTRMTNDIESLNEMFSQGAITLIADAIKAVIILAIMLSIDVDVSLMTFAPLPLVIVLVEVARRAMHKSFRQIRVRLAAMNAFAQEHLFGIRVLHLLGRGKTAMPICC